MMPTARQQELFKRWLLPLPRDVQVSIAILQGGKAKFLGVERTENGLRYLENQSSVFEIGSITKVFTATLLAQQVTDGNLDLDAPVENLLPLKLKTPGRGGVDITLKHLASHLSGMCHQPPGIMFQAVVHLHPREPFKHYSKERFEQYLKREMKLRFTPGTRYLYSNMGMSLAGYVLSHVSGKSYESLLGEMIFEPLGMRSSSTEFSRVEAAVVRGVERDGVASPNWDMHALAPCGGIKTSAEDFALFMRSQLNPDASVSMTHEPAFTISDGYFVGMGWHIIHRPNGEVWLNHGGGMRGYTAIANANIVKQCSVIVLSNLGNAHKLAENISKLGRDIMEDIEMQVDA